MLTGIGDAASVFILGFVAGIGAGLLLAPQSGARTRRQLHRIAKDLEEETSHLVSAAKTSVGRAIERGKTLVG